MNELSILITGVGLSVGCLVAGFVLGAKNSKGDFAAWTKRNIDFPLFLAIFTETPRWTVAFLAINEPLWVGVPLGVLIAFATSKGWRRYFETKDWRLLAFNGSSIVIAVAVIAPVLYAMTNVTADKVNISQVLFPWQVWIWASLLAVTTFTPLIQLAFVQDESPQESAYRKMGHGDENYSGIDQSLMNGHKTPAIIPVVAPAGSNMAALLLTKVGEEEKIQVGEENQLGEEGLLQEPDHGDVILVGRDKDVLATLMEYGALNCNQLAKKLEMQPTSLYTTRGGLGTGKLAKLMRLGLVERAERGTFSLTSQGIEWVTA